MYGRIKDVYPVAGLQRDWDRKTNSSRVFDHDFSPGGSSRPGLPRREAAHCYLVLARYPVEVCTVTLGVEANTQLVVRPEIT